MRLIASHLRNFCQHKELDIEFINGINGIFGANGSGKSNALRGIYFGFTGESPNVGVKQDDLTFGADSGYVENEFLTVDGHKGVIKRHIKSASCTLKIDGETIAKNAKDVEEKLWPILGVPREFMKTIFVHQEEMDAILFERPAKRAEAFQKLFGTWCCEERRDQIQAELAKIQIVSYADRIVEIRTQLDANVRVKLAEGQKIKTEAEAALSKIDDIALRKKMEGHANAEVELKRIDGLRTQLVQYEASKNVAASEAYVKETELALVHAELQQLASQLPALQAQQQEFYTARNLYMRKQQILGQVDTLLAEGGRIAPAEPKTPRSEISKLDEEIQSLHTNMSIAERMVHSIGKDGKCNFCQSVLTDASSRKQAAEVEITVSRSRISELLLKKQVVTSAWVEYDRALSAYSEWSDGYQRRVIELQTSLKDVQNAQPVSDEQFNEVNLKLQRHVQLAATLRELTTVRDRAKQHEMSLESEIRKVTDELSRLEAIAKQLLDSGTYEAIRKELMEADRLKRVVAEKTGELKQLADQQIQLMQRLDELQKKETETTGLRAYFDFLTRGRGVLHRDCLPNRVAQKYRAALNAKLFEYLQAFQAPFTASMKPDLSFICEFENGMIQPAERLSGGQRVLLAIAFRFSVNKLFASKLGLLVLDEPTSWLDDSNTVHLANVLSKAREITKSGALQVLLITHADKLKDAVDRATVFN